MIPFLTGLAIGAAAAIIGVKLYQWHQREQTLRTVMRRIDEDCDREWRRLAQERLSGRDVMLPGSAWAVDKRDMPWGVN